MAVDAFCDADTRRDADDFIQLGYARGGFDAAEFRQRILPLLTSADTALVYGSGFETQPELLAEIAQHGRLIGNPAETVSIAKDAGRFFGLLAALSLPCPQFSLAAPGERQGVLKKRTGGSGGTQVAALWSHAEPNDYYQRQLPGQPISLLFLADGVDARAVGYNLQLLAPSDAMPYRFGGAVSGVVLPPAVRAGVLDAARRITAALGLRGLNSLDCLVHGDSFHVLEINPRLSATFALYDSDRNGAALLRAHLAACGGQLAPDFPLEQARAHLIYYAPFDLDIPADMVWPEWTADRPQDTSHIPFDAPLCTVMAAAESADEALALARWRVSELTLRINQLRNE